MTLRVRRHQSASAAAAGAMLPLQLQSDALNAHLAVIIGVLRLRPPFRLHSIHPESVDAPAERSPVELEPEVDES